MTPRLQGNEKALRSAGLLKTGRSTYVPWDTQQVEQTQGQRPTGSGLYGLEGPKGGGLLNEESALPLTVEQRQFLPSTGHLIVTGGIDEGWGEVEITPVLSASLSSHASSVDCIHLVSGDHWHRRE